MNNLRRQYVNTQAVFDVIAERARQVEGEGWSPEHDDAHGDGSIAAAASCYARDAALRARGLPGLREGVPLDWPWARSWWKPRDERANLVRAGALILAEIERIDRAKAREVKP